MYVRSMSCCGVREISGLYGIPAPKSMRDFCAYIKKGGYPSLDAEMKPVKKGDGTIVAFFNPRFRYVFFTQANPPGKGSPPKIGYGYAFAAFIRKHKLGEVVIASEGDHINPNSNNFLKMWTWTVDHAALNEWFNKDTAQQTAAKADKKAAKDSDTLSL